MFLLLQTVVAKPAGLTNLELWSALAAMLVPFVVATIVSEHWSSTRTLISFVVVAVATAFVTTWLTGDLDRHDLTRSILIVLIAAQAAYHSFKPAVQEVQVKTSKALGTDKPPAA